MPINVTSRGGPLNPAFPPAYTAEICETPMRIPKIKITNFFITVADSSFHHCTSVDKVSKFKLLGKHYYLNFFFNESELVPSAHLVFNSFLTVSRFCTDSLSSFFSADVRSDNKLFSRLLKEFTLR
jgi:hypothetical protein